MARYDRIARLDCPEREDAFPAWMTLRDLEGREREPELGRRARLRFLALRPVWRMLQRGIEAVDDGSFAHQIKAIRQELDQLPARDRGRALLMEYLEEIGGRSPRGMVTATLDVGADAELTGHPFAAEEFYRTALELSEAHDLTEQRLLALRHLGRVLRDRGETGQALALLEEASRVADRRELIEDWARAVDLMASVHSRSGDNDTARRLLDTISERGESSGSDVVRAIAAAGRCAVEFSANEPNAALEAGWDAIERLEVSDEDRNRVLLNMASAFRRLGLWDAAESCYSIVERWSTWPEHRAEARVEHAVVAVEAGNVDAFRERRAALSHSGDRSDPRSATLVDLGLGRGCLLIGDTDVARAHLRAAISTARDADLDAVLRRAEKLLELMEDGGGANAPPPRTQEPVEVSLDIGALIDSLRQDLAAAR